MIDKSIFSKPRFFLFFIALVCIGSLGFAYIGEYFFSIKPCILCLYQRYAYMAIILVALIGMSLIKNRHQISILFVTGWLFLVNFGIATYQVLVEKKIVALPALCKGFEVETQKLTFAQFQEFLTNAGILPPCDEVAWELFGISMAGYNALFTILCALACFTIAIILYAPYSSKNITKNQP